MFRHLAFVSFLIPILFQIVPAQKIESNKAAENRAFKNEVIDEIGGIRQNPGKYKNYLD